MNKPSTFKNQNKEMHIFILLNFIMFKIKQTAMYHQINLNLNLYYL